MSDRIYFDHNAATPLSSCAKKALLQYLDIYANPASIHQAGVQAKTIIENSRNIIAQNLNLSADNIIFTSGATEAASNLLTPYYKSGNELLHIKKLYLGATEHFSIINGGNFAKENVAYIKVDSNGLIDYDDLIKNLAEEAKQEGVNLVAIQAANGETGVIQDIESIAKIVHHYNCLLIVDLVQYLGKARLDLASMNADFYIISSHKIGGPKNVGALINMSKLISPQPLIHGKQERGLRGGTNSPALCAAFAAALQERQNLITKSSYLADIQNLRDYFEDKLKLIEPNVVIFGAKAPRLPNTSCFALPNIESHILQIALDLEKIAVSSGSACNSGNVAFSHVLNAMFEPRKDLSAIRVSLAHHNDISQINELLAKINLIYQRNL